MVGFGKGNITIGAAPYFIHAKRRTQTGGQKREQLLRFRAPFSINYVGMSNLSSSSSNNGNEFYEFGERFPIIHCKCGHQLKIRTSWTNENPGRRFWLCSAGISRVGCGFVDWYDPPMCFRSKRIIPGLLKRINRQDEEIRVLNMKLQGEKQQEKGKVFNKVV